MDIDKGWTLRLLLPLRLGRQHVRVAMHHLPLVAFAAEELGHPQFHGNGFGRPFRAWDDLGSAHLALKRQAGQSPPFGLSPSL
jgi:hypothetical protein